MKDIGFYGIYKIKNKEHFIIFVFPCFLPDKNGESF